MVQTYPIPSTQFDRLFQDEKRHGARIGGTDEAGQTLLISADQ